MKLGTGNRPQGLMIAGALALAPSPGGRRE